MRVAHLTSRCSTHLSKLLEAIDHAKFLIENDHDCPTDPLECEAFLHEQKARLKKIEAEIFFRTNKVGDYRLTLNKLLTNSHFQAEHSGISAFLKEKELDAHIDNVDFKILPGLRIEYGKLFVAKMTLRRVFVLASPSQESSSLSKAPIEKAASLHSQQKFSFSSPSLLSLPSLSTSSPKQTFIVPTSNAVSTITTTTIVYSARTVAINPQRVLQEHAFKASSVHRQHPVFDPAKANDSVPLISSQQGNFSSQLKKGMNLTVTKTEHFLHRLPHSQNEMLTNPLSDIPKYVSLHSPPRSADPARPMNRNFLSSLLYGNAKFRVSLIGSLRRVLFPTRAIKPSLHSGRRRRKHARSSPRFLSHARSKYPFNSSPHCSSYQSCMTADGKRGHQDSNQKNNTYNTKKSSSRISRKNNIFSQEFPWDPGIFTHGTYEYTAFSSSHSLPSFLWTTIPLLSSPCLVFLYKHWHYLISAFIH